MTLHQAMTQALAKMRFSGLSAAFGSVPGSELEVKLQADAYLEAIGGATKREITAQGLGLTAAAFISGSVRGHDPAKFPGAAEFAQAYAEAMDAQFMCLGVSIGDNTVKLIEVRRDTPQDEIRKIIQSNTPRALEHSNDDPVTARYTDAKATYVEKGKSLVAKFSGDGPAQIDETEPRTSSC